MAIGSGILLGLIVAIWGAYLLQHWIKRRDHAATARSVDRYSEAMRVLERRRRTSPRASVSAGPRSYAVSPLRPATPEVSVKRARPDDAALAPTPAPVVSARAERRAERRAARQDAHRAPARRPVAVSRRTRGVTLLVSLVLALGVATAVVVVPLPFWALAPAALLVLAAVVWLHRAPSTARARAVRSRPVPRTEPTPVRAERRPSRPEVRRERPARRSAPAARAEVAPSVQIAAARATRRGDRRQQSAPAVASASRVAAPEPAAVSTRRREAVLYDVDAAEASAAARRAPAPQPVAAPAEPGTWTPMDTPPPAYTLKAKAPRREAPLPVADLPFEGSALDLDEVDEDLPAAFRAG